MHDNATDADRIGGIYDAPNGVADQRAAEAAALISAIQPGHRCGDRRGADRDDGDDCRNRAGRRDADGFGERRETGPSEWLRA